MSAAKVTLSPSTLALMLGPTAPRRRRRKARIVRAQGASHPVLVLQRQLARWGQR